MFIKAAKLKAILDSAEITSMRNLRHEEDIQQLKHDIRWLKLKMETLEKTGGVTFDTKPRYVTADA